MLSGFFFKRGEHALNSENNRSLSNSLLILLHSAFHNSATFGSSRSPCLGVEMAPESHFIPPCKRFTEPGYSMLHWSSDSAGMLLPMRSSLLHKGAHPTLVSKLFLILRGGLPFCNPYRPGHLPQGHSAWLPPCPGQYMTAFHIPGNGGMCLQERHPQSPLLSLRHHDFQTTTAQSALISPPFHSQYVTPRGNTTPSNPALQGWAELSFQETR